PSASAAIPPTTPSVSRAWLGAGWVNTDMMTKPYRAARAKGTGLARKTARDFCGHLWHRLCPCRAYASPRACTATRVRHRASNGLRIFAVSEVAPRLGAGRGAHGRAHRRLDRDRHGDRNGRGRGAAFQPSRARLGGRDLRDADAGYT